MCATHEQFRILSQFPAIQVPPPESGPIDIDIIPHAITDPSLVASARVYSTTPKPLRKTHPPAVRQQTCMGIATVTSEPGSGEDGRVLDGDEDDQAARDNRRLVRIGSNSGFGAGSAVANATFTASTLLSFILDIPLRRLQSSQAAAA
ncbi:hypothetical protein D9619_004582 [Psilocybe cf. subviscida]|uniref:Uncharacterized protein n=1 Tax=Psilocybe cf. subviscida TaxID=2480587 RepID=A0A8H5F858_9AGAR|nr:hypothetical protein D9619_004582 [Psilocybe cf. subviscida]